MNYMGPECATWPWGTRWHLFYIPSQHHRLLHEMGMCECFLNLNTAYFKRKLVMITLRFTKQARTQDLCKWGPKISKLVVKGEGAGPRPSIFTVGQGKCHKA